MNELRFLRSLLACIVAASIAAAAETRTPPPPLDPELRATFTSWLAEHGKPPRDYVVGLFARHDVVFLGELHYVKHDVQFVATLFEPLYASGVRTFAVEFARREDQHLLDSLTTSSVWDERLAREVLFRQFTLWGYSEYVDLYRAAWKLNLGLAPDAPRFRVLGVNDSPDWSVVRTRADRDDDAIKRKVWRGGGEQFWAQVILDAVEAGEKVLVYSGAHHAFTEYRQPVVVDGKFVRFDDTRMGNYVYRAIGKRAITVCLHAPWPGAKGYDAGSVHPAGGVIDALMLGLDSGPHPVGFDVPGSPFAGTKIENAVYANGYDEFRLSTFCDGWIYTKPISQYESVTTIPDWIRADNLDRARAGFPNPDLREYPPEHVNAVIARSADVVRRWGHLE